MHFIGNLAGATLAVVLPGALVNLGGDPVDIESSRYWEDDAWWDVTEWFDGNDVNSTNEAGFELDPQSSEIGEDPILTEGIEGYDAWYGFDGLNPENDWFYDFYDDGYSVFWEPTTSGVYRYSSSYHDYDGDGFYDAFYSYNDLDGDGRIEDVKFTVFDDVSDRDRTRSDEVARARSSAKRLVIGKIAQTKQVSTRNAKHLVVHLQLAEQDPIAVDVGAVRQSDGLDLTVGAVLEAHGPIVEFGGKPLMFAERVVRDGEVHEVSREGLPVEGDLIDLQTTQVAGREHTVAMLSALPRGNRWLVDLGPSAALDTELEQGDRIVVRGVPCRKDRKRVLMANKLHHGSRTEYIDRTQRATAETPVSETSTDG